MVLEGRFPMVGLAFPPGDSARMKPHGMEEGPGNLGLPPPETLVLLKLGEAAGQRTSCLTGEAPWLSSSPPPATVALSEQRFSS